MSFGGALRRGLYWTNDALHGSRVRSHYDELSSTMRDYETGRAAQKRKLNDMLSYVVKMCPYFEGRDQGDLSSFPVTNKMEMIDNKNSILVPQERVPGQEGPMHIQRTSGSTGVPFEVAQDTGKRNRRVAELKWFNTESGFPSHERLGQCRIWTKWQSKSSWQAFRENIMPINITAMDEEALNTLCRSVENHRLVALRAYASWYTALAEYLQANQSEIPRLRTLKTLFSSSEALDDPTKEYLEATLACHMIEAYANEENGLLAQQMPGGGTSYVLNHSGYVFEILKFDSDEPVNDGEMGRIVLTDLHNHAYPFIRYDTGDAGIIERRGDGEWPVLAKLYGRKIDLVYDSSDKPIHPMLFARVLKNISGIRQWQFVQKNQGWYELRVNTGGLPFDEAACLAVLLPVLGPKAVVSVAYVDEIPVLGSGKRRPVVCEWEKPVSKEA